MLAFMRLVKRIGPGAAPINRCLLRSTVCTVELISTTCTKMNRAKRQREMLSLYYMLLFHRFITHELIIRCKDNSFKDNRHSTLRQSCNIKKKLTYTLCQPCAVCKLNLRNSQLHRALGIGKAALHSLPREPADFQTYWRRF